MKWNIIVKAVERYGIEVWLVAVQCNGTTVGYTTKMSKQYAELWGQQFVNKYSLRG